jgi:hypothetical protein
MSLFQKALQRPANFRHLSAEDRWAWDKSLGILDWDGNCDHQRDGMCAECRRIWEEKFDLEIKKVGKPKKKAKKLTKEERLEKRIELLEEQVLSLAFQCRSLVRAVKVVHLYSSNSKNVRKEFEFVDKQFLAPINKDQKFHKLVRTKLPARKKKA